LISPRQFQYLAIAWGKEGPTSKTRVSKEKGKTQLQFCTMRGKEEHQRLEKKKRKGENPLESSSVRKESRQFHPAYEPTFKGLHEEKARNIKRGGKGAVEGVRRIVA